MPIAERLPDVVIPITRSPYTVLDFASICYASSRNSPTPCFTIGVGGQPTRVVYWVIPTKNDVATIQVGSPAAAAIAGIFANAFGNLALNSFYALIGASQNVFTRKYSANQGAALNIPLIPPTQTGVSGSNATGPFTCPQVMVHNGVLKYAIDQYFSLANFQVVWNLIDPKTLGFSARIGLDGDNNLKTTGGMIFPDLTTGANHFVYQRQADNIWRLCVMTTVGFQTATRPITAEAITLSDAAFNAQFNGIAGTGPRMHWSPVGFYYQLNASVQGCTSILLNKSCTAFRGVKFAPQDANAQSALAANQNHAWGSDGLFYLSSAFDTVHLYGSYGLLPPPPPPETIVTALDLPCYGVCAAVNFPSTSAGQYSPSREI